jgi:hypothetical protein
MARTLGRVLLAMAFLALGVFYYFFLGAGPTPSERPDTIAWWRPLGLALRIDSPWLEPLQQISADYEQARHEGRAEPRGLIPLVLFALPPIALVLLGLRLFSSAVTRVPLLALGLTLCAFSYYGWLNPETWQDYTWRWPAVLLVTSLFLSLIALAPPLVREARSRSAAFQVLCVVAFLAIVYVLSIEVTGTNPRLEWNLSPWPTLTLYGFLLVGLVLVAVHLAVAAGLLAAGGLPGRGGIALGALVAGLVAAGLHRIPFARTGVVQIVAVAVPAMLVAAWAGRHQRGMAGAAPFALAGLLVLASIKVGQWQGEWFQAQSRDRIAPTVIAALERYRGDHGTYPEELENLVPQYLPEIPLPRIGWLDSRDETFLYTYLGDSFLLEFPSVIWVQCAYSPAYRDESVEDEGEGEAADEGSVPDASDEMLTAAWSCASKPPRLW